MAVYLILFLLAAGMGIPLCGICEKKEGRGVLWYCIAVGAVLTVISSLRFGVGYDYNLYAGWYYDLNFTDFDGLRGGRKEIGMFLPLKLLNLFTSDYAAAFPLISLMIYVPLTVYIFRRSDNPWISFAAFLGMGLYFNSMNFMRQFIAAVICAIAFGYAAKGCRIRYLLIILFGAAFHRSALFLIPCFLFAYIGWNTVTFVMAAVISAGAFAFSGELMRLFTKYFYSDYTSSSSDVTSGLSPVYAVMFGVLFLLLFALRKRTDGEEHSINITVWCGFFAFFFELLGTHIAIISRLSLLFFIPAVCLGVPKICSALYRMAEGRKKGAGVAVITAAVILLGGSYYMLIARNYNGVMPYRTIFERTVEI